MCHPVPLVGIRVLVESGVFLLAAHAELDLKACGINTDTPENLQVTIVNSDSVDVSVIEQQWTLECVYFIYTTILALLWHVLGPSPDSQKGAIARADIMYSGTTPCPWMLLSKVPTVVVNLKWKHEPLHLHFNDHGLDHRGIPWPGPLISAPKSPWLTGFIQNHRESPFKQRHKA